MRNLVTAVTLALMCLVTGTAVSGCGASGERSADAILDDANETMRGLKSVRIDSTSEATKGGTFEQIRIGTTDYVRPDRKYLHKWNGDKNAPSGQGLWVKARVGESKEPENGLVSCEQPFDSFGRATKGDSTRIDGRDALAVTVTDKTDKGGTCIFYVASEGKPYLLRTVYKGTEYRTTTSFRDFDEPLDVQAPKAAEVLDAKGLTD
ncbi:outer membrane lipoprotein carrier protein LolA [Streptomyces sp. NPDC001351]|uniref:LolA family protein n=1 Tax=Streptomyces sp. NPDC001351 TaxID=3364564 RepID=UPI0036B68D11